MMGQRFDGRNIAVVGGGGSLGAATAVRLASEGANLFLAGQSLEKLEASREEVLKHGGSCDVMVCDVTVAENWVEVAARIDDRFGSLHGMTNFAAVLSRAGLEETTPETWDSVINVNLTGAWLAMRSMVPLIKRAGGGGIVNIGSIDALVGRGASTAYAAAKGGLRALSKSAAMQYAPDQIRVNSVHPSPMETRIAGMVGPTDPGVDVEALLQGLVTQIPLGRLGAADDIAGAVAYLLSDDAAFVTGVDLPVDGGYVAK